MAWDWQWKFIEDDLLSSLPDHLLLHIISFLDTKNAIRTGILSRRWLRTSTPNLYFRYDYEKRNYENDATHDSEEVDEEEEDKEAKEEAVDEEEDKEANEEAVVEEEEEDDDEEDDDDEEEEYDEDEAKEAAVADFFRSLHKTLLLHSAPKLQNFGLSFKFQNRHGPDVDLLIRFALSKRVRELHLDFHLYSFDGYELPSCLFKAEWLVSLKLTQCRFSVPDFACFRSLVSLSLTAIRFQGRMLHELLAVCYVLEDLVLLRCHYGNAHDTRISFAALNVPVRCLTIERCTGKKLQVEAPVLEIFKVTTCSYIPFRLSFENMYSLEEAFIHIDYIPQNEDDTLLLDELLKDVCHARVLHLSVICKQAMSVVIRNLSYIFDAKSLILKTGLEEKELQGLIQNAPFLEILIIELTLAARDFNFLQKYEVGESEYWKSLAPSFPYMADLKTIKISGLLEVNLELNIPMNNLVKFLLWH